MKFIYFNLFYHYILILIITYIQGGFLDSFTTNNNNLVNLNSESNNFNVQPNYNLNYNIYDGPSSITYNNQIFPTQFNNENNHLSDPENITLPTTTLNSYENNIIPTSTEYKTIYIATPIYLENASSSSYLKVLNPDLNQAFPNGIYYPNKLKEELNMEANQANKLILNKENQINNKANNIMSSTTNKEVIATNLPKIEINSINKDPLKNWNEISLKDQVKKVLLNSNMTTNI